MKKILAAALCAACLAPPPAMAASADGKLEVKVLATGVLPDGKIDTVKTDLIGLPAGSQAKASDTVVPTIAIEYYATPDVSIETICCLTQHHVNGDGALAGTNLVNHVLILPATVTLKYHLNAGPIKPYVGVGPSLFIVFDPKPGVDAAALGAAKVTMPATFGLALQAGVDIPVNDTGMGISLDAKRYFMKPTAKFYDATDTLVLETKHKLDPWVVSGGIYFRF